jgi:hypothetical protein
MVRLACALTIVLSACGTLPIPTPITAPPSHCQFPREVALAFILETTPRDLGLHDAFGIDSDTPGTAFATADRIELEGVHETGQRRWVCFVHGPDDEGAAIVPVRDGYEPPDRR